MRVFKLVVVLSVFTLFACQPKYYIPNTQQVTMFEEEGDVNLTLCGDGNQWEVQAGYAFTDRFAASANFSRFSSSGNDNGREGSGLLFEVAPGFYKPFGDNFIFESYAILGFGSVENYAGLTDSLSNRMEITANGVRIGLQPSLSKVYDRFSIGLSTRLSSVNYANIKGNLVFDNINQVSYLEENKSNLMIEPALTARFGGEFVRAQAQYGFSYNASNTEFLQNRQYLTIGINVNMNIGDINL